MTALTDSYATVRRIAVLSLGKLLKLSPESTYRTEWILALYASLKDDDTYVVCNALNALLEQPERVAVNACLMTYLWTRFETLPTQGQLAICAILIKHHYHVKTDLEKYEIMNFLEPYVADASTSTSVLLSIMKVFLHLHQSSRSMTIRIYERMSAPLLLRITPPHAVYQNVHNDECADWLIFQHPVFETLVHIVKYNPTPFLQHLDYFVVTPWDSHHVIRLKVKMWGYLATKKTLLFFLHELLSQIVQEEKKEAHDDEAAIGVAAVTAHKKHDNETAIGPVAVAALVVIGTRLSSSLTSIVAALMDALHYSAVQNEVLVGCATLVQWYPAPFATSLRTLWKWMPILLSTLDERGGCAALWLIAEQGRRLPPATTWLATCAHKHLEHWNRPMKLQFLTTCTQVFLSQPTPAMFKVLQLALSNGRRDVHMDVRDRSTLYCSLLKSQHIQMLTACFTTPRIPRCQWSQPYQPSIAHLDAVQDSLIKVGTKTNARRDSTERRTSVPENSRTLFLSNIAQLDPTAFETQWTTFFKTQCIDLEIEKNVGNLKTSILDCDWTTTWGINRVSSTSTNQGGEPVRFFAQDSTQTLYFMLWTEEVLAGRKRIQIVVKCTTRNEKLKAFCTILKSKLQQVYRIGEFKNTTGFTKWSSNNRTSKDTIATVSVP